MRDYHTAQNVRRADTSKTPQETVLSERFYLADADFLVGLSGDRPFLKELLAVVRAPVWILCLGRKSFVPSLPVAVGICEGELLKVVQKHPWRKRLPRDGPEMPLRIVTETAFGQGEPRQDVPLSFVSRNRLFRVRHVRVEMMNQIPPVLEPDQEELTCT
jgi:CRISPR system Cascade subunit CasD